MDKYVENEEIIDLSKYKVKVLKEKDEKDNDVETTCIQLGNMFIPECGDNADYIRYKKAVKNDKIKIKDEDIKDGNI